MKLKRFPNPLAVENEKGMRRKGKGHEGNRMAGWGKKGGNKERRGGRERGEEREGRGEKGRRSHNIHTLCKRSAVHGLMIISVDRIGRQKVSAERYCSAQCAIQQR